MKEKVKSISMKKQEKEVRVSVEEIENGFLIIRSTEWNDPKKGWQYETRKWFSESNPLEDSKNEELSEVFNTSDKD